MSRTTHFILNDTDISTQAPVAMLVLDFLRHEKRLVGTKEGCKEGDCGACVVLIGELGKNGQVHYKPVTSCLMPVAELQGKHLVTIEGLNMATLTPVQQAIVDAGGTQCGFCTPGIVVSLTGSLIEWGSKINEERIAYSLGGNLCRCTGYASLKRAGKILIDRFGVQSQNGQSTDQWVPFLIEAGALPDYFQSIPERLGGLPDPEPQNGEFDFGHIIAGGTDIYVQKGDELPEAEVAVLDRYPDMPDMKGVTLREGQFHIGAMTTFEEFAANPDVQAVIPKIQEYMHLIASWQIRNRATLGGNIVNASPIGDMTILLLALDAELILRKGAAERHIAMTSFFLGYKQLDLRPAEILTRIVFPLPAADTRVHFEKVSKRKTLDIASVNSAIKIRTTGNTIESVNLTLGGVAPIPLYLEKTSRFLEGKAIMSSTITEATRVADTEIAPISDIRGSADYKRLLARQLLRAHFIELFPESVTMRAFYETS